MYVVIDSSIWISQQVLTSAVGSAVRYYLRNTDARLVLPEVVRLETQANLRRLLKQSVADIESLHAEMLPVFNWMKPARLPTEGEINAVVASIFDRINVPFIDVPFSLESARSSFEKVINYIPPSSKGNQQFKDGVIWADCVRLLDDDNVSLVSSDKSFYRDRTLVVGGLAPELQKETEGNPHVLQLFPTLGDLLSTIRTPIQFDEQAIRDAFTASEGDSVQRLLDEVGFEQGPEVSVKWRAYATDDPSLLLVDITIKSACNDVTGGGRTGGRCVSEVTAQFNPATKLFSSMRPKHHTLSFVRADGSSQERRNLFIRAGGTREVIARYGLGD